MSSLLIKNIPDDLKKKLKEEAERNHRSVNKQAVALLEKALGGAPIGPLPAPVKTRTRLSAAWVTRAKKWGRL